VVSRVTNLTIQRSSLANLQTNLQNVSDLQAQLSSGKKVTKASDDPAAAAQLLSLRGEQARTSQYNRNSADATSWLNTVDTSLQTASTTLRRARDLVIQGGNTSLSQISKDALATEIDGIKESMLGVANTSYLGRSVFAGTSDAGAAFDSSTYAWNGVDAAAVERQVSDATSVRVDSNGSDVFGEGTSSVFATLDQISATLRAGGNPTTSLNQLDAHITDVKTELASIGARENQIEAATTDLTEKEASVKTQLSSIEDIDLASVILSLQSANVTYQAALGATSKVLTPSLMEYLQ
jgi:flagellar hook-associated protein 3 FlgL